MATIITSQQQRIALVDPATGQITREWLDILRKIAAAGGAAGDTTALQAALDAALVRIGLLEVALAALTARVAALEAAAGAGESDATVLQPSPGPQGAQGEQGPQGEPGESPFPPPLHPIPLDWPEELRSLLELSGSY